MTDRTRFIRTGRRSLTLAVSLAALLAAMPVLAQEPAEVSGDVALSMLDIMVKRGLLAQTDADAIIAEAKAKARQRAAQAAPAVPPEASLPPGTKRVTYVPDTVRDQIRDEVKKEVMAKAKDEGWATPNQVPEWTQRIKVSGDIRGRYDGTFFPKGNAYGTPDQANFNSINSGGPIDVGSLTAPPEPRLNVDANRNRMRLRARVGVDADLGDGVAAGMRLATGDGSSPVSTNQTLGGSGGDFSKYQVWLDRAFLHWDVVKDEEKGLALNVGRFDNPFFGTDLIWDDDLGFDGIATTGRYQVANGITPFVTVGAFPVYNTDFNFSSDQAQKYASQDKWLYGAQVGADWKASKNTNVKIGAAYYYFDNIAGQRSSPCDTSDKTVGCNTDATRTSFSQKGNTMMALRNKILFGDTRDNTDYQYYGLATGFREFALTGRVDYDGLKPAGYRPLRVSLGGEFVKNLAFDKNRLEKGVNNKAHYDESSFAPFDGGDTGYLMRLTVGTPKLAERWDWNASLAYKYVESDAVVDGMTDSDFGMGGTNLKGFIVGGNLALGKNLWTSLRWMSADNISGSPFSEDTVLLDLTGRF